MLLTSRRTRPALRNKKFYSIRKLKGVVAHWTANTNPGADAVANRSYFNNTDRYASAHFVVDDHSIVQCVPENEVAYHAAGKYYRPIGESIMEDGLTPNYFLIGFEMCVNSDGNWQKTYQNSIDLARHLLEKHKLDINQLFRHYDITGKDCPKMMLNESDWNKFKEDVATGMNMPFEFPNEAGLVNTNNLNARLGPGVHYGILDVLQKGDNVEIFERDGNWGRIGREKWTHLSYVDIIFEKTPATIVVDDPEGLNVRTGPGVSNPVVDVLTDGTEVTVYNQSGNWYKIKPSRWIYGAYVKFPKLQKGVVNVANFLNVRKGAGTTFELVDKIPKGTEVTIYEELNSWYRIGEERWVYGAFIELEG